MVKQVVKKLRKIYKEPGVEFTAEEAICALKDEGIRNIPTGTGLSQMIRKDIEFFEKVFNDDGTPKKRFLSQVFRRKDN